MPSDTLQTGSPQDWLRHARSDLALAEAPKARNVLYAHLCFHAQQAAEKALKAVLVANGVPFSRTHDLAYLVDLLPAHVALPSALARVPTLTRYAVQQRYPGAELPVSRRERQQASRLARAVVAWAGACLH